MEHPAYGDFRFSAVVDWIEVAVTLDQPTQPRHVRDRIRSELPHWGTPPFVVPVANNTSGTSKTITFRLQCPVGPTAFMRDLQHVRPPGHRPLIETDVQVLAIEVALDLRQHTYDREGLVAMCLHMFRHRSRIPPAVPIITEPGHFRAAARPHDITRALAAGYSINSPRGASLSYRARHYVKASDSVNGAAYMALPQNMHCARMEATLDGPARPFTTVAGWRSFRFETLAPFFALRRQRVGRTVLARLLLNEQVQFGMPHAPEKASGHRRQTKHVTMADSEWGERMRIALRALTRAQRRRAGIRTDLGTLSAPAA